MNTPIPFVDLKVQLATIRDEIDAALGEVLDNTAFAGGRFVSEFEEQFANYCECEHAIGVGSGTDALWLALLAQGVGEGDEVITVPTTFIATAEAIHFCGAEPVFVDIDPLTYTMDPAKLEAAISPRTKAIVPVHLYGQPADMISILEISERHGVPVVEDACQAHGARYAGRRVGSLSDAACFSFYPGKNLGAYGEAGAVVTQDAQLAEQMRALRDHGQFQKNDHKLIGWNARMDGFQGAVLGVKLRHLDDWNESRRANARHYDRLLAGVDGITLPHEAPYSESVYHLYVVRSKARDQLLEGLRERGVQCGVHYPVPLHLQPAFEHLGGRRGDFPVAERCADEVLSLPMFAELKLDQLEFVAEQLKSLVKSESTESLLA
jgi:dTDP-4-amino-4,6-dideoxygalactose transaminase